MSKQIRIGFIGAGAQASVYATQLLHIPTATLVGVTDKSLTKAKEFSRKFGIKNYYNDYLELLKQSEIDAVIVVTPPYLHAEHTIASAEAGKHVLCDKPIATNLTDAGNMIKSAKKSGVKLMYGENERFNPVWQKCKEFIEQGTLGTPIMIMAYTILDMGNYPGWPWMRDIKKEGGGAVMESCHDLYVVRWLFGDITQVYLESGTYTFDISAEDTASISLKFRNGAIGNVSASWSNGGGFYQIGQILGTSGNLSAVPGNDSPISITSSDTINTRLESDLTSPTDIISHEFNHFIDCILNDNEPIVTGEDGESILRIIKAAYESKKKGTPVSLS